MLGDTSRSQEDTSPGGPWTGQGHRGWQQDGEGPGPRLGGEGGLGVAAGVAAQLTASS